MLAPGLNDRVAPMVAALRRDASTLRIGIGTGELGEAVIDTGLAVRGSIAAGCTVAEIAMGGLGRVGLEPNAHPDLPWSVGVRSSQPALACLGSQLAGWHLRDETTGFAALGSGPARALAAREPVFDALGFRDEAAAATLLVEANLLPPPQVVDMVATACGLHPSQLTLIVVPSSSLAGSVQVAARVLEAAIGKARHAGFPLQAIVDGLGTSPLAPPHPDPAVSMGRTNDAMIYGGAVHLFVTGPANAARDLARHLPSSASQHHGRAFADILAEAGGDFYAVDPLLFGPAAVRVTALDTGDTFVAGRLDPERVSRSFAASG